MKWDVFHLAGISTILTINVLFPICNAIAQPAPVRVEIINGDAHQNYQIPWTPNISVLNALELALPAAPKVGAFSLNYFPQYNGYFVSAVAGVPSAGSNGYWSTAYYQLDLAVRWLPFL
jgi:hypothetical protein